MSKIKNIVFDLGGVIINLDITKTIKEFNQFSQVPFESVYTQLEQNPIFDLFDKGQISELDFFNQLTSAVNTKANYSQMVNAWNAMLLDFPTHRLQLLKDLKPKYKLFLLSNTNETHITEFENQLHQTHGYPNLNSFFEKVYYSCRIGMRKPDTEIFKFVLNQNQLIASETIFIDDSPQHVKGAESSGIKGYLLNQNRDIKELIEELNL